MHGRMGAPAVLKALHMCSSLRDGELKGPVAKNLSDEERSGLMGS